MHGTSIHRSKLRRIKTRPASGIEKWEKYFPGNELPIGCYYADDLHDAEFPENPKPNKTCITCIFGQYK